jgi:hypothetical protein
MRLSLTSPNILGAVSLHAKIIAALRRPTHPSLRPTDASSSQGVAHSNETTSGRQMGRRPCHREREEKAGVNNEHEPAATDPDSL